MLPCKTRSALADEPAGRWNLTTRRRCSRSTDCRTKLCGRARRPTASSRRSSTFKGVALSQDRDPAPSIAISGSHYNQRLVVEGTFADGHQEDLTSQAQLTSSDPKVAAWISDASFGRKSDGPGDDHRHLPWPPRTAFPLSLQNFTAPVQWSFRNDVMPVLTKMGCNSGPLPRRGGGEERLQADVARLRSGDRLLTLTHQALARRTERMEPAKSLILLKPTLTIPHGGGKRFAVGSPEYQVVSGWIAARHARPAGLRRARHQDRSVAAGGFAAPRSRAATGGDGHFSPTAAGKT